MTQRPVYLNLFKIRLPLTGMVSFAHRVSGTLLFLVIPVAVYLLDRSLESAQGFDAVRRLLSNPVVIAVQVLIIWSLVHHLLAGVRFLLIDFDVGVDRRSARASALILVAVELLVVAFILAGMWL